MANWGAALDWMGLFTLGCVALEEIGGVVLAEAIKEVLPGAGWDG